MPFIKSHLLESCKPNNGIFLIVEYKITDSGGIHEILQYGMYIISKEKSTDRHA